MTALYGTQKNLTVIQTAPYFQVGMGGPDHYLCKGLSELNNYVHLITSDRRRPGSSHNRYRYPIGTWRMTVDGFEMHRFRTLFEIGSVPFLDWHVSRFLSKIDFDVIHTHEIYYPHSIQSLCLARKKGKVFGVTQHRYYCPRGLSGSFLTTYYYTLARKIFDLCDFVFATSRSAADFLRDLGVRKEVHLLPNSIDVKIFKPITKKNLKEKLGLQNRRVLLYIGRMHKEKGLKYLIEAFEIIKRTYPDSVLVLVGKGPDKENIMFQAKRLGLREGILLIEYFPHDRLFELYNLCDVLVLPSLVEPFGMVLIEAMACGQPVVGSNVGGISDIIDDGENGFLVEPRRSDQLAEKISVLLSDEKLRRKFGNRGRKKVEDNYSYQVVAKKALSVYERALERK